MGQNGGALYMNVLVIGCGKVGVRLAEVLSHYGHNVSIVDGNAENFTRLSDDFDGLTDVYKRQGIMIMVITPITLAGPEVILSS